MLVRTAARSLRLEDLGSDVLGGQTDRSEVIDGCEDDLGVRISRRSSPIMSTFHWKNSLSRPFCGRSARHKRGTANHLIGLGKELICWLTGWASVGVISGRIARSLWTRYLEPLRDLIDVKKAMDASLDDLERSLMTNGKTFAIDGALTRE